MAGVRTPRREFLLPEIDLVSKVRLEKDGLFRMPFSLVADRGALALPTHEALVLAAICSWIKPRNVFEYGTYTGLSSLVMAANTPDSTKLFTLDIDPRTLATHQHGLGAGGIEPFKLGAFFKESAFSSKVHQLLGDSQKMRFEEYRGKMDLIFVDADHSYSFVLADSLNALDMRSEGGVVVWDDYVWHEDHPECSGVAMVLHDLHRKHPGRFFRIKGSRLAVYLP